MAASIRFFFSCILDRLQIYKFMNVSLNPKNSFPFEISDGIDFIRAEGVVENGIFVEFLHKIYK